MLRKRTSQKQAVMRRCGFVFVITIYLLSFLDDADTVKHAKEFEKQGVMFAESDRMDQALEMFSKAIDCSPMWASAYNNRAQALRLLKRNEGTY